MICDYLVPVTWYKMDKNMRKRNKDIDQIYGNLKQLKQQINDFIYMVEGKNVEKPKHRKIQVLTKKTKHLLNQHKELKRELRYYENIYKKALVKNVRSLKSEIKENQIKLRNLKEKCRKTDVQIEFPPLKIQDRRTEDSKKSTTIVQNTERGTVLRDLNSKPVRNKLIKITTQTEQISRKNFKKKRRTINNNNNIKIQVKKNKIGKRELFFFKANKTTRSLSDLIKKKGNQISSFRECRITLQKLTEEQVRQYTTERKLIEQQQNQELSPKTNQSKSSNANLNWQIRIPKSVLEESQKIQKIQNFKLNVPKRRTSGRRPCIRII
ncbi:uncharacterized protein LOC144471559 [Augochlora pura]